MPLPPMRCIILMEEASGGFRLAASKYLLTWPRAEIKPLNEIMFFIESIERIKYAVVSQEEHMDGGTHYHCFVQYMKRLNKRRNVFNDAGLGNCNVEVVGNAKKDIRDAINYVKKDGLWTEAGVRPDLEKKMAQKEKIRYAIDHSINDCIDCGQYSISEICKIPTLKAISKEQRKHNGIRKVFWFYGPTGTGKTRLAVDLMEEKYKEEYWISNGDLKNFKNGYTGQQGVILDDLRCGDIKFNDLLRLCDRYKYNTNIKGTNIPWLAEDIIITSPLHPMETFLKLNKKTNNWEPREDIEQLLRRIHHIKEFPDTDDTEIVL